MLIDPKNSLLQALQNVSDSLNLDDLVRNIAQNLAESQTALQGIEFVEPALGGSVLSTALTAGGAGEDIPVDMGLAFVETAGVLIVATSQAVGAAINDVFGDLKNDGTMETYSPNGERVQSDSNVYVINGVDMDEDLRKQFAIDSAKHTNENVNIIHNATAKLPLDGIEYLMETIFSVPSPPTERMSDELYNKLTSDPPEKVKIIAYSQGSSQTAHALSLTITRLKADGMTDEEIRQLMSDNVDVTMIGTPMNLDNPMQTVHNVPPGLGIGQKRLDWYFTTEDVVLHGDNPPTSETVNKEGSGEANFTMIRHEKDPIATWVRDLNPYDAVVAAEVAVLGPFIVLDPIASVYLGARVGSILAQLGTNLIEEGDLAGYHDYQDYYNYMENGLADAE